MQAAQQDRTPDQLPAEIPIIILARKAHHIREGPKLHRSIASLIPLAAAPAIEGAPELPLTHYPQQCGALNPAALQQSDALILGKAPKLLLGDVLWHAAPVANDIHM